MTHLPHLISDLALVLGAGAVVTLIFKRIKQPLVLGYIIAGFLVGPHVPLMPTVIEDKNINILAQLGVIFLLFSLGLEFSFKKLIKVGGPASITAIFEVVFMILLGFATGTALGWSGMDSLFLGGILSISSTTIIIRAFEELGVKTQRFASLVFGVLIVEDLVAIVLMVLLSTLAVSRQFSGDEMLFSILKLFFFLVIWFIGGIFLIPTILKRSKKLLSEETLLIVSIALCLLMVVLANKAGFSPALGAFIMGSILAETTKAEKIEHLVKPVKDLFGAIFFISVGMLIDPATLVDYAGPILLISVITIAGKIFSTACGALISGQSLQTSVQAGFSLAQIGEFSFIIATLGLTLNVTSAFLYPIAVAVSAVTTLTTPFFINSSKAAYKKLSNILPQKFQERIVTYSSRTRTASSNDKWKIMIRPGLAVFLVAFLMSRIFNLSTPIIVLTCFLIVILSFLPKVQKLYNLIELRFTNNLNQREIALAENNREELAPWDARIVPVRIKPNSLCVGATLSELRWREKVGVNIVLIKRGDIQIAIPGKDERIFPEDEIYILGTDSQINRLQVIIRNVNEDLPVNGGNEEIVLRQMPVGNNSPLIGVTIRESGIKERLKGLVVGIERNGDRILNPESDVLFKNEDIIFLVGDQKRIDDIGHI